MIDRYIMLGGRGESEGGEGGRLTLGLTLRSMSRHDDNSRDGVGDVGEGDRTR